MGKRNPIHRVIVVVTAIRELDYPKKNSPLPVACLFFWAVTPTALSLVT
jgi:hypothetical protein